VFTPNCAFSKLSEINAYIYPPSVQGPKAPRIAALWAQCLTLRREGHTTTYIVTVTVHNKQSVDSKWSHSYLEAVTDGEASLSSVCLPRRLPASPVCMPAAFCEIDSVVYVEVALKWWHGIQTCVLIRRTYITLLPLGYHNQQNTKPNSKGRWQSDAANLIPHRNDHGPCSWWVRTRASAAAHTLAMHWQISHSLGVTFNHIIIEFCTSVHSSPGHPYPRSVYTKESEEGRPGPGISFEISAQPFWTTYRAHSHQPCASACFPSSSAVLIGDCIDLMGVVYDS